jgi:hypothetical protein
MGMWWRGWFMACATGPVAVCAAVALLVGVAAVGAAAPTQGPDLAFAPGKAEAADGNPPVYTAAGVCGSDHETYLKELVHTAPTSLTVKHEWGDIVPGGKQVMVSGTVTTAHAGPGDLPMSHPFGDDLSMDVALDPQFRVFSRQLGAPNAAEPRDELHLEISAGMIPHVRRPPSTAGTPGGETWRQLSDFNLSGLLPGFEQPAVGDRMAVMGRWIIDCGHEDYGTELHAISFIAWAHQDGSRTVVHTYFNPYRDTELYGPDAKVLGEVNNKHRTSSPDVKEFPPYFVDEVVRLLQGKIDHLRSQELVEATVASPAPWRVCAPTGTTGGLTHVRYDIVARPGVRVRATTNNASGCATLWTDLGRTYRPAEPKMRQCVLPWDLLDAVAGGAIGSPVDVRQLIKSYVPEQVHPLVDHDPDTTCADALAGPRVHARPTGRVVRTDRRQPFPFYGVITVSRT